MSNEKFNWKPLTRILGGIVTGWIIFGILIFTGCIKPTIKSNGQDSITGKHRSYTGKVDTLFIIDTVYITDTVYKHDTVRIESESVKNLKAIIEHQNQMIRKLRK